MLLQEEEEAVAACWRRQSPSSPLRASQRRRRQAALLDLKTLTWTDTGTATKSDLNDEEGWTLLPDGRVLTVDCYTDSYFGIVPNYPANPTNSEIYDPRTRQWSSGGSTINSLTDPRYDVVAIGNAIVDVLAHADDGFLKTEGLAKGAMTLIDDARA